MTLYETVVHTCKMELCVLDVDCEKDLDVAEPRMLGTAVAGTGWTVDGSILVALIVVVGRGVPHSNTAVVLAAVDPVASCCCCLCCRSDCRDWSTSARFGYCCWCCCCCCCCCCPQLLIEFHVAARCPSTRIERLTCLRQWAFLVRLRQWTCICLTNLTYQAFLVTAEAASNETSDDLMTAMVHLDITADNLDSFSIWNSKTSMKIIIINIRSYLV